VYEPDGTSWLRRSAQALVDGGCEQVFVVLGAAADEARPLLDGLSARVVVADDWADGLATSLCVGLAAVGRRCGVLVSLVDLPDVGADVVARVLASDAALARAAYDGRPGHPVLLGANHIDPILATLHGDLGARADRDLHDVTLIECGDLATGLDVDHR
jgi:CTP:molybdopterin cytidylyltransferase MocA